MSLALRPRRTAYVCGSCESWPCRCRREPPAATPYVEPTIRVERCVCGGFVTAYTPTDLGIIQAVREHNRDTAHILWRRQLDDR